MAQADLHLHTIFSDGTETPERVVELAARAGLSMIAITDHDNVEAFGRAQPVAQRRGIELLSGIELSSSAEHIEVHILGVLFDLRHAALQQHLRRQQARRVARVHEMVERLRRVGVTISAEEVLQLAGEGTVGRPHVARILLKHGYVTSLSEAFARYIGGPEHPGFVPGSTLLPAYVIRLVRDAGGIPILAHPVYLKRDALIPGFVKDGLVGIEVYHPGHTPEMVRHYERLAEELGLLKSGGSDCHGDAKEGSPIGSVRVPVTLIDALKQWKLAQVH